MILYKLVLNNKHHITSRLNCIKNETRTYVVTKIGLKGLYYFTET